MRPAAQQKSDLLLPSLRGIRFLALGAPLWLLAMAIPAGWIIGAAYIALLLALFWRDAASIPTARRLHAARELPPRFAFDVEHSVKLRLKNGSGRSLRCQIYDDFPDTFVSEAELPELSIPAESEASLTYAVRPLSRGSCDFGDLTVLVEGRLGLVRKQLTLPLSARVKVYPNFRGADQKRLLAQLDQRQEIVRKSRPVKIAGTDFESLRPYVPGEDPRNIDWKATARRGAPVSRNKQVEKGQQLAILLDTGRLMAETIGHYSKLEHALNAAVMLSYAVQKRGDALCVAAFSNRIESFLPPVRGPALLARVLESLYAIQVRQLESDYWQAIAQVMALLTRRSLVVLMTDVLDVSASNGLINNLARAAEKHVVLCVVLSEPAIHELARALPVSVEETYRKAAACDLLRRRWLALESMRARGILVLETAPEHLSGDLIQRYLEIRRANLQ